MTQVRRMLVAMVTRLTPRDRALRAVTERAWQAQVAEILRLHGWRVYHTYDSRRSESGFPDICAVHPRGELLFAELKTETGGVIDTQVEWMHDLAVAGADVYLWRPRDVDRVIARAKGER